MLKYSWLPVLLLMTHLSFAQDTIWVDTFDDGVLGELPSNWGARFSEEVGTYVVSSEEDNQVLCAHTKNSYNSIIKKVEVDIVKYPYLNWKWKGLIFPPNGDESVKEVCDVIGSMNVILRASRWRPKTIKYSWSTTLAEGTRSASPFAFWPARADILVVQSGEEEKDIWVTEKVNVLEDYLKFYDLKDVDSYVIQAVLIMTDSDNTLSESKALYDDIYFTKK